MMKWFGSQALDWTMAYMSIPFEATDAVWDKSPTEEQVTKLIDSLIISNQRSRFVVAILCSCDQQPMVWNIMQKKAHRVDTMQIYKVHMICFDRVSII